MAEFYDDGQIFESKVGHDTDKYSKQSPDKSDDCLVAFGQISVAAAIGTIILFVSGLT